MKYISMLLVGLYCISGSPQFKSIYWENMPETEKAATIELMRHDNNMISRYLNNEFVIGDNDCTMVLLAEISDLRKSDNIKAYYFDLYNNICIDADGAIAEMASCYVWTTIISA